MILEIFEQEFSILLDVFRYINAIDGLYEAELVICRRLLGLAPHLGRGDREEWLRDAGLLAPNDGGLPGAVPPNHRV